MSYKLFFNLWFVPVIHKETDEQKYELVPGQSKEDAIVVCIYRLRNSKEWEVNLFDIEAGNRPVIRR